MHLLVILLFVPVPYVEKIQKSCHFHRNNTFFAPSRVWRISTGFGDCFCRVSETFPRGSWLLGLPSLLGQTPDPNDVHLNNEQRFLFNYVGTKFFQGLPDLTVQTGWERRKGEREEGEKEVLDPGGGTGSVLVYDFWTPPPPHQFCT